MAKIFFEQSLNSNVAAFFRKMPSFTMLLHAHAEFHGKTHFPSREKKEGSMENSSKIHRLFDM